MRMGSAPFIAVPAAMDPIPVDAIDAPVIDGTLIPVAIVIHRSIVHGVIPIFVRATPTIAVTAGIIGKANSGHANRETESGRACRRGREYRSTRKGGSRDTNLQQSFHLLSPLMRRRSLRAASEPQMNRSDIYAAEYRPDCDKAASRQTQAPVSELAGATPSCISSCTLKTKAA